MVFAALPFEVKMTHLATTVLTDFYSSLAANMLTAQLNKTHLSVTRICGNGVDCSNVSYAWIGITRVDSAFYPPWDGEMSTSQRSVNSANALSFHSTS